MTDCDEKYLEFIGLEGELDDFARSQHQYIVWCHGYEAGQHNKFIGEYLDKKVAELEKENEELKEQIEWLEKCESELGEMLGEANETITELKSHCKAVDEVNEKMKCCENCKHQDSCYAGSNNGLCEQNLDKWELKE